jgi:hypothetical protein
MKARLHLILGVLAVFALALPGPAFASIQFHPPHHASDAGAQLANRTDFNNKTTKFSYDVMWRLLQQVPDTSFGTNSIITFTYTVSGQRATMNDVSGSTTYQYDANRDWLVGKTKAIGSYSVTLN